MDSQSVKTVEESAGIRGYDAHKRVKGRKRHLLVDTLGLPISIYVTPADMHDTQGARRLLAGRKDFVPRLEKIWADAAYRGKELAEWRKAERTPGVRGFSVAPKRWVVERTFPWLSRSRRLSKEYERKVQTSETLIEVAMIRLPVARLGPGSDGIPNISHHHNQSRRAFTRWQCGPVTYPSILPSPLAAQRGQAAHQLSHLRCCRLL